MKRVKNVSSGSRLARLTGTIWRTMLLLPKCDVFPLSNSTQPQRKHTNNQVLIMNLTPHNRSQTKHTNTLFSNIQWSTCVKKKKRFYVGNQKAQTKYSNGVKSEQIRSHKDTVRTSYQVCCLFSKNNATHINLHTMRQTYLPDRSSNIIVLNRFWEICTFSICFHLKRALLL